MIADLKPCPWCGCRVEFHGFPGNDECSGCHNIVCTGCKAFVDLSSAVDTDNEMKDLAAVRAEITKVWNMRKQA